MSRYRKRSLGVLRVFYGLSEISQFTEGFLRSLEELERPELVRGGNLYFDSVDNVR